ncbi:MAG TPA: DUF4476 domain-containing protein [Chitinophagaceae bacterium]|nr:DUF4476 domain-containing protein [Chitinophagaceae bacterium]
MKRIFTFLASLILSISLFAADARPKSTLTVKSLDRGDIRVVVDGRRFEPGVSTLVISGLDAGYHTVKIYREKNNGFFNVLGHRYEMVYNTSLSVRPKTNVSITIDRFGRTTISETRINGHGRNRNNDWGRQKDDRDWDYDRSGDREYDYDHDGKFGDYDTNYGYEKGMSDHEFSRVLEAISTEWLESNKLKSATQIVTTNMVTTMQVKQLMRLFSFESNKLELAKKAYSNTVDKKNFFMVNDEFNFNSSKDDLARFIRNPTPKGE